MVFRKVAVCMVAVLLATLSAGSAHAASFPSKRLHMTILFGAGAGADVVGRKLADLAAKELGQNIVCTNRTGGGGAVGYQYVLNTAKDGYNVCWNSTSINVVYHQGNMKQDYSAFAGVANITKEMSGLAVAADAPWKTMREFIEHVKANPGEVTVANSGVGSFNHLIAAAIEDNIGGKFKHIPLNSNESTVALLGGKVNAIVNNGVDLIPQVQSGAMRVLVMVGDERMKQLPDAPTMKELGYELTLTMWRGITVPKGVPQDVVDALEKGFIAAAQKSEFAEFAEKYGVIVDALPAKEFDEMMAKSDKIVADIMEKLGIKKQ